MFAALKICLLRLQGFLGGSSGSHIEDQQVADATHINNSNTYRQAQELFLLRTTCLR